VPIIAHKKGRAQKRAPQGRPGNHGMLV